MSFRSEEREILRALYNDVRATGVYPTIEDFQKRFGAPALESLGERGYLCTAVGRVQLRLRGLRAVGTKGAEEDLAEIARVREALKAQTQPELKGGRTEALTIDEAVRRFSMRSEDAARQLTFLEEGVFRDSSFDAQTGLIQRLVHNDNSFNDAPISLRPEEPEEVDPTGLFPILNSLRVSGYRALDDFHAELHALTVIIGANASGKSSVFDILRLLSFASTSPFPPEIDPRSVGRLLFHLGRPERLELRLDVSLQPNLQVGYNLAINGPIGSPQITNEELVDTSSEPGDFGVFFFSSSSTRRAVVRRSERFGGEAWTLPANELTLRRVLDPKLVTSSSFQRYVSSWRFYEKFDTGPRSAIRRPVYSEPHPVLASDGSNLSAVLFWLMTEHQDAWTELEMRLRSAIPGSPSLSVKPRGGPGTVLGIYREEDLPGELTLADLSEGTLNLLCWAALCLSPEPPPLVCIDEPELGLHPRVLPVLASLLRTLATKTQVLVATHSPYLLTQFDLESIAVMRREGGRALFLRPAKKSALRAEIEELGGEELARMHISDELEARS